MSRTGEKITATAAAGAVIAAYWFYGPEGARHRREMKGWALRMKGEILEKLEAIGRIERDSYHRVVDRVALRYEKLKRVNHDELETLVRELKDAWEIMTRDLSSLKGSEEKETEKKKEMEVSL